MRIGINAVSGLLVVMGVVWFLQGINILPGSFMTGQIRWAVNGAIAASFGVVGLVLANRHRAKR